MTEATPDQVAMARRIVADRLAVNAGTKAHIIDGYWDRTDTVRCTLAAIIETSERAANMADLAASRLGRPSTQRTAMTIATALRNGDHLKEPKG